MGSTIQTLVLLRLLIHTIHVFHMRCLGNVSSTLKRAAMPIVSYLRELKAFHSLLVRSYCQADGGTYESTFYQPTTFLADYNNIHSVAPWLVYIPISPAYSGTLFETCIKSYSFTANIPCFSTKKVFLIQCIFTTPSYFFSSKVSIVMFANTYWHNQRLQMHDRIDSWISSPLVRRHHIQRQDGIDVRFRGK
jgi:hypothetical protein